LLFGKETKGLPESLIFDNYDNAIRIPMKGEVRSLNLSNSVAIVLYEALRQHEFYGFDTHIKE
jgi:tRNA (cytidine/uridine-2'-O-)-methyltransferase